MTNRAKNHIFGITSLISVKEEEGEKERAPNFLLTIHGRQLEFVEPRTKAHRLDVYQKGYISPKIQRRRFGGNQSFQVYEVFSRPPTIILRSKR